MCQESKLSEAAYKELVGVLIDDALEAEEEYSLDELERFCDCVIGPVKMGS